ncbi:MAG: translation initiation factor IF-2 [Pseudomonadota bacterium]
MAKIRVYELARTLNMKNKALLDKLRELNITVATHMSSLEDDEVLEIKASISGKTATGVIEETRVKPTIIRRRKTVVRRKAVDDEPLEDESADEASEDEVWVDASPPEEVIPDASVTVAPEAPPVEAEPPTVTVEVAPEPTPALEAETLPTPAESEETAAAPEAAPSAVVEPVAEPLGEAEPAAAAPSAAAEAEPAVESPAKGKARRLVTAKSMLKNEKPAKIIKMGSAPPPKPTPKTPVPAPPEEVVVKQPAQSPAPQTDTEDRSPKDKKKKGIKPKVPDEREDKKFVKKRISFRRKEVVEGADLYSARAIRGRKGRKGAKAVSPAQKTQITTAKAIKRRVKMDETIVLAELAKRMGIKANEMIGKLMGMGVMATVNQTIDYDTAVVVATEFGYEIERAAFEEETFLNIATVDAPETMKSRPPVVTIMGHVDHGKTSLLDVIRKSRITDGEAGGITQHIGAYSVATEKGQIVFLDTPGHEAFTAMRSRGAQVTDIVILVVAADDGVMPQTQEAINHSRAAGVPIIVAINKIDKPGAEPDRVQRELAEAGLSPEEWGGDTIFVKVSAKEETGIDELLEMILLQSEMLEIKANPDKPAMGTVIEAKLESGRGPVATVLIQEGTLKTGDVVVCGVHYGKVRALLDDLGMPVDSAGPAMPVEILGLSGVPNAGDELVALADEKDAKQVSAHRSQKQRSVELAKTGRMSLDGLFAKMKEGEVHDLNLIVKADVHGSIEALSESLVKLANDEVKINIVHAATGTISESDVSLAAVSNAIIIGFNVRPNAKVQTMANEEHVDMRFYNIIYNVIKDVQDAIVGLMASTFKEHVMGRAEVRQVFQIPKVGAIAGCYVTDGKIQRGAQMRLLRDGVIVYEGKNASLRRFKDDAKEVQTGYECGISIEHFNDIKVGDTIECFYMEEIRPQLG